MLFFDIETRADPGALGFLDEPSPPSNWKDPDKIKAYVEDKRKEQIEKAALDADFGQIVAIGVKEDDQPIESWVSRSDQIGNEVDALIWFWHLLKSHHGMCCGYNVIGFDLPYLLRRSFAMGVKPAIMPDLRRYRTYPTLDLMMVLFNWSGFKGLKFVADRYDLDNPLPDLDGSQVASMDEDILRAYVENDVSLVYQLYLRMKDIYF